jgi:hypothetical protein
MARRKERIPGGLAKGMSPKDFEPAALRKGIRVELEHTDDWRVAEEIAMDHLVEDPRYYDKLEKIEARPHTPNRRPRVVDAYDVAKKMRETFADRPVEQSIPFDFGWPTMMQNVGDSLAVAYASDKWTEPDARGRRDVELYKHLAESRNRALVRPGVMYDYYRPNQRWPVAGPQVSLSECPMPKHFAILGLFEEIDLELAGGEVVHVSIKHAYLGGSKIRWSTLGKRPDEPFIFVYTEDDGVMAMVIGEELDVEKDGIVG